MINIFHKIDLLEDLQKRSTELIYWMICKWFTYVTLEMLNKCYITYIFDIFDISDISNITDISDMFDIYDISDIFNK